MKPFHYPILVTVILFQLACNKKDSSYTHPTEDTTHKNRFDKGIGCQEDFDFEAKGWKYYFSDTVCTTTVKFIALDSPVLSYNWAIGAKSYSTKEVMLNFPGDYLTRMVKTTLQLSITYKTKQGTDTSRTFRKELSFLNPCNSAFNGRFKGSLDGNPADTLSFIINTCAADRYNSGLYLYNNKTRCGKFFSGIDGYYVGYKQIVFNSGGDAACGSPGGYMSFRGDTLQITYHSFDNGFSAPLVNHVFKGIKL